MTTKITQAKGHIPQSPTLDIVTPLSNRTLFWRPHFLQDAPVLHQLPFLFWLIEVSRPRAFAAVGEPSGVGYFAICQALDKLDCDAICHHFGGWPEAEVPAALAQHNSHHYEEFSQLHPEAPSPAYFGPNSLDLLLLDLPRDSDLSATVADWLPCLSERGMLLLHGVSAQLGAVQPLRAAHPNVLIEAGSGMLLVLLGEVQNDRVRKLAQLSLGKPGYSDVQKVFRRLGRSLSLEARIGATEQLEQKLSSLRNGLRRRDKDLAELTEIEQAANRKIALLQSEAFDSAQMRQDHSALQTQFAALQEDLAQSTGALDSFRNQVETTAAKAQKDLQQLTEDKQQLAAQLAQTEQALQAQHTEQARLTASEQSLQAKLAQESEAHRATCAELQQAQRAAAEAQERLSALQDDCATREDQTAAQLAAAVQSSQAESAQLAQQIKVQQAESAAEIAGLHSQLNQTTQAQAAELEALTRKARTEQAKAAQELATAQNALEQARQQHKAQYAQGQAKAQGRIEDLEHQYQAQKKETGRLAQMLNAQKVEANRVQHLHEAQLDKLRQEQGDRFRELAQLTKMLEAQEARSGQASAQYVALQHLLQERVAQQAASQQHIAELEAYAQDLAAQLQALRASTSWRITKPARKLIDVARGNSDS